MVPKFGIECRKWSARLSSAGRGYPFERYAGTTRLPEARGKVCGAGSGTRRAGQEFGSGEREVQGMLHDWLTVHAYTHTNTRRCDITYISDGAQYSAMPRAR